MSEYRFCLFFSIFFLTNLQNLLAAEVSDAKTATQSAPIKVQIPIPEGAQPASNPVPSEPQKASTAVQSITEYICTKGNKTNLRNGPGTKFKVIYNILKAGYPLKVVDRVDNWYAVSDFVGDEIWINVNDTTKTCGGIVKTNEEFVSMNIRPTKNSAVVFKLENGFILRKLDCYGDWCKSRVNNKSGWILKQNIWGIK